MSTRELVELLEILLDDAARNADPEEPAAQVVDLRTFRSAGLLTNDDGLVVRLHDGTEFQLTVVRSRGSRTGD